MPKILKSNYFQLPVFLILGGICSALIQNDVLWDFANYHYYNPWALVNNRVGYDIAVGGGNGYFNPLLDLPLYYLIVFFNDYPNFISFMQGLPLGALFFVFLKFIRLFFTEDDAKSKVAVGLTFLIGCTGWALYAQIGSCSNEITIALLVMCSMYLIVCGISDCHHNRKHTFLLSGFILGSALGLKLTAIIYCVSAFLTIILCSSQLERPKQKIISFIIGGALGFLLFHGWWSFRLWQMFSNPLFPFANGIFKSPWFVADNFRDPAFLLQNWREYLFYPFYFAAFKLKTDGRCLVVDYRFGLTYLAVLLFCWHGLKSRLGHNSSTLDKKRVFLVAAIVTSYVVWISLFVILRYTIPLALMSSILIVKTAQKLTPQNLYARACWLSCCVIILYSLLSTPYYSGVFENRQNMDMPKQYFLYDLVKDTPQFSSKDNKRNFSKYIEIEKINIPHGSLLEFYNLPVAAILPMLNVDASSRGIMMQQFNYVTFDDKHDDIFDLPAWRRLKQSIISNHKGPVVQIIGGVNIQHYINQKDILWDKNNYCRWVYNNIVPFYMCVNRNLAQDVFKEKARDTEFNKLGLFYDEK